MTMRAWWCALGLAGPLACVSPDKPGEVDPDTSGENGGDDSESADTAETAAPGGWSTVDVRGYAACALTEGGAAVCWGWLDDDSVGTDAPATGCVEVTLGLGFGCALDSAGVPTCWGCDSGDGCSSGGAPTAPSVAGLRGITADKRQTCALDADGGVFCWGCEAEMCRPPEGEFLAVSVGYFESCALSVTGRVVCWRDIGDPASPAGDDFVQVSVGSYDSCALHASGAVTCWGYGTPATLTPPSDIRFQSISVGSSGACGITVDESVVCWGEWYSEAWPMLTNPPTEGRWRSVSAGDGACAISTNGDLFCWEGEDGVLSAIPSLPE